MRNTKSGRINSRLSSSFQNSISTGKNASSPNLIGMTVERIFDLFLASLCIVPMGLILGLIFLLYRVYNRKTGSFFFKGERLGKNKKPFLMYKVRTLNAFAEKQFAQEILTPGSGLELKFGKFLRATRLDELPQIFNILRGDMRFIGPRPLRQSIYESNCQSIPNYDLRFSVKPGLFGYSQILTPHTAPKRVRAFIDNRFISKRHRFFFDIFFIFWAIAALIQNLLRESTFLLREYCRIMFHRGVLRDRRKLRRISGEGIEFAFFDPDFVKPMPYQTKVLSLNNDAVAIASDIELKQKENVHCILKVHTAEEKTKRVQCKAFLYKKRPYNQSDTLPWFYVLFYMPISDVNRFILDQYILKQSISQYLSREYSVKKGPRDLRRMRRIPGYGIDLSIHDRRTGQTLDTDSRLVDINSQSLRMTVPIELDLGEEIDFMLTIYPARKKKRKKIRCNAWVYRKMPIEDKFPPQRTYVLNYTPVSEVNRFLLEKYVLKQSIRN